MKADKGELRNVMVKNNVFSPTLLIVAGLAVSTLAAPVNIVFTVAGIAGTGLFHPISTAPVALYACNLAVLVSQREFCLLVIKSELAPPSRTMTGLTFFTVASLVFVIVLMTAVTGLLYFLLIEVTLVTGMAIHFFMPELQGKFRFLMVKMKLFPIIGLVAVLAFFAVSLVMHVINNMTGITIKGSFLISSPGMTGLARDLFVLEPQFEICLFVVKTRLCPAPRIMAFGAVLAESALVRIVFVVAGLAF